MQEDLDRSRGVEPTSMDREVVEKLLRSYRDKLQKARWIEIALTSVETRRKRGLLDSNLSRAIEKLSRWAKTVFQGKEKHRHECNQACNTTKDPINILSSQNHLSITILSTKILKTHTHTLNKSNQFYISKISQDSLVSIH